MRRLGSGLALSLGTVLFWVIALELFFRLSWVSESLEPDLLQPEAGAAYAEARMLENVERDGLRYLGRPGAEVVIRDVTYRHNDLGLRSPEVAVPKPAGIFRILVIGDSNVYAWGVPEEEGLCARLRARLDDTAPGRFDVVCAGIPGYNNGDHLALFHHLGERLEPDLVLHAWFVNDLERLGFRIDHDGYMFCDPLPGIPGRLRPWLWRSFLYRFVSLRWLTGLRERNAYTPGEGEDLRYSEEKIVALHRAAREAGVRTAMIDVPWLEAPTPLLQREDYYVAAKSEWLAAIAAREGVPLLPLLDSVAGQPTALLWASIEHLDHHPNAEAHHRFADSLLEFLRAQALIPGS